MISRVECNNVTNIEYGSIDIDVNINCSGTSAFTAPNSAHGISLLIGRLNPVMQDKAVMHTFNAISCRGNLNVATVEGQTASNVSGLIG